MNGSAKKVEFMGYNILKNDDGLLSATDVVKAYNEKNNTKKVLAEFWSNNSTIQLCVAIEKKFNLKKAFYSKRGNSGGTWMHEELMIILYNWLHKIPNQSISRDELTFYTYIEESFDNILKFERQKRFDNFFVDLYCEEIRLCIEFDEKHHQGTKHKILDEERQKYIEDKFEVNFLRHKHGENYSKMINKIINYKQAYNVVQEIKKNKIPRKGYL